MLNFYGAMWEDLMGGLEQRNPVVYQTIRGGIEFKDKMHKISVFIKESLRTQKLDAKKVRFRAALKDPHSEHYMTDFGSSGLTSPLEPRIKLYGVEADSCTIFRSAIAPVLFQVKCRVFSENYEEREN
jgi:hypothetical protein